MDMKKLIIGMVFSLFILAPPTFALSPESQALVNEYLNLRLRYVHVPSSGTDQIWAVDLEKISFIEFWDYTQIAFNGGGKKTYHPEVGLGIFTHYNNFLNKKKALLKAAVNDSELRATLSAIFQ